MRTSMTRAALATAGIVGLLVLGGGSALSAPNQALPKADLLIMQAPDVLRVSPGQIVTFTSYAANNGPSPSQLDATVEGAVNLTVKRQRCQFVSPDTPSCEFGVFAPGRTARMRVTARVTGSPGDHAALTVCAADEGESVDPNPSNDCTTTTVAII